MKKLSIVQKAKRYDEALKVANKYKDTQIMFPSVQNEMFPELREPEDTDEKVRKALIKLVTNHASMDLFIEYDIHLDEALAWLEKQGEKTEPIEGFDTEFERQISHFIASIANKEYEYTEGFVKWVSNSLLKYAKHEIEKQGEQKSAWSEKDEKNSLEIKCLIGNYRTGADEHRLDSWIDNLKDRVQPQNNITDEELAQAKKDAYNDALDKIEYHSGEPTFDDGWDAAIWNLKKRNAQPQNTWKPSAEQMGVIEAIINNRSFQRRYLDSLYDDLKKL